MILKDDVVLLRDFKREDIAKRIEWETVKTEWQMWDAPWEYEGLTEEQKKEELQRYKKAMGKWAALCETLSDIIQVTYFKLTHGKRIFKMAPLHHHFEMCGWKETKIVAVFAAVSALFCVLAYLGVMDRFGA